MLKFMILAGLIALGGCVGADGRPAFGAKDEDQVFTFLFNGSAAKVGSCWAEGLAGKVEIGTNLFGFPQVTIRGRCYLLPNRNGRHLYDPRQSGCCAGVADPERQCLFKSGLCIACGEDADAQW